METRQQRRKRERAEQLTADKVAAFRRVNPMAEATYKSGYSAGWEAAVTFCMKDCYAAATLALHELEGYGTKRNRRFLRLMDRIIIERMTTEELMDAALQKGGVALDFGDPFDRVVDV